MSTFSTQALQEKLSRLSLSQDSIETLSLWIIQHKAHSKDSVQVWLEEVKKASADKRLVLFYLANDILQNGRRKGADLFLEQFEDPLRQAVTWIGGQKIQTSIERMFRIWKERRVYSNAFLKELELLIEPVRKSQVNESLPDFKLPLLQDALSEFAKFEAELKVKSSHLSNLRVDISNPTTSLSMLKDKSAGGRVSQEFEEACQRLQDYCECLGIEVNERINIVDMLKECKVFTTYRLAELERTVMDYKNLSQSVDELKTKIDQRLKDLERAHSTATSDPSAKEDITDVGDMEIESDGENQEPQATLSNPAVPSGPGMLTSPPPMATYPANQQDPRYNQAPPINARGPRYPPSAPPTGPGGPRYGQGAPPTVPMGPRYSRPPQPSNAGAQAVQSAYHQRPRPMGSPFQGPSRRPPPPRPPPPGPGRGMPRPRLAMPMQRPPPPRMQSRTPQQGPPMQPPHEPRGSAMQRPPMSNFRPARPPYSGPGPGGTLHSGPSGPGPGPGGTLHSGPKSEPGAAPPRTGAVISSSPVMYKKPSEEAAVPPVEPTNVNHTAVESKPSLDDRLKGMGLNVKFGEVLVKEEPESDSSPYSPSATDQAVVKAEMVDEEDKHSLPTPSSDSPADPDISPNMDNPILKALYQGSPDTTSTQPSSLVPDYEDDDNDELSSTDLKNILDKVISSEPPKEDKNSLVPPPAASRTPSSPPANITKPVLPPSEIKITPTLTSLLDEIFPKISKSLMDRKRKQEQEVTDVTPKAPRLSETPPNPMHMPPPPSAPQPSPPPQHHQQPQIPQQLQPQFLPRSSNRPHPFGRPGFPPPPMRAPLPPPGFFPPPPKPDMGPNLLPPPPRPYDDFRFSGPGMRAMQPPMRNFPGPRMYRAGMPAAPGYRPPRPHRYV